MQVVAATVSDIEPAVDCLARAFANDAITGYLLRAGPDYRDRLTQFFSLLMRARVGLGMPVFVARDAECIAGAVMGYDVAHPTWPQAIAEEWDRFEQSIPGFTGRMAVYDGIAQGARPSVPHYYLGVIGADPSRQGNGIGRMLLQAYCARSASDPLSRSVYLETANPSNVGFYQRAGFVVTGEGALGRDNLWCMFLPHD